MLTSTATRGLVLIAIVAIAWALAAQTPSEAPRQQPPFRTEANFVRVDVYPTRDGKPVQDLRREDFELLEDNRPQAIDSFEYVRVGAAGAPDTRSDPNTIEAMRQSAADPKSRIFVIFLDAAHVSTTGAHSVSKSLIQFVDRMLAPDDLVGVMTSWMSPADVVLARKTQVIQAGLERADWGRRFTAHEDDREAMYKLCYRVLKQEMEQGKSVSDVARALIVRRREELTLGALRDLVVYLRGIREERKAIVLVSEGWALYRADARITRLREECTCPSPESRRDLQDCQGCQPWPPPPFKPWKERVPGDDPIRVGPGGRLEATPRDPETEAAPTGVCTADRVRLANIDHSRDFRDLINDANRSNASFYTIDPRGLATFDTPMGRADEIGAPLSVAEDQQSLSRRLGSLTDLASGTDGIALTNSNDLTAGLRRIADDLSSYYLLGYYSTNGKLDGRYRSITVRVKRPGVQVRARPGYRAPTEAEVTAARALTSARASAAPATALASAFAALARIRPEPRFRMHAALGPKHAAAAARTLWIAGELPAALQDWARGANVGIEVAAGAMSNSTQIVLKPGERGFLTSTVVENPGPIDVRARVTNPDPAVTGFTEAIRIDYIGDAPQPLFFRRGPTTANRLQPAADFQFARSERLRVEVPLDGEKKVGQGRLLDKNGQELKVPVIIGERTDASNGQRWLTADVTLAALGAGDYAIELAMGAEDTVLSAFRVTR